MLDTIAMLLAYLGLSPPDMFAGFCGTVFNIAAGGTKPGKIVITLLANTLASNYIGAIGAAYIGVTAGHIGAFFIGFGGQYAVRKIIESKVPGFFTTEDKNGKP